MKPLFSPALMKKVVLALLILLAVKLLWFAAELLFFPAEGVNHAEGKRAKPLYYRIKLTPNKAPAPKAKLLVKPVGSIRDITLLGIYNSPETTVVTVRYKGKSKILGKGESVNGFVLERAGNTYAIFSKNGKTYKVTLARSSASSSGRGKGLSTGRVGSIPVTQSDVPQGEIVDAGDHKIVDRSLLEHYTRHMNDIYKNIGITEVKKHGAITGFRVTFVKRGTPFAKLGLRRGDVLKEVNGQPLDSYKAAFDAYKGIKDAEGLTLKIQRGNKEMELEYEIN